MKNKLKHEVKYYDSLEDISLTKNSIYSREELNRLILEIEFKTKFK